MAARSVEGAYTLDCILRKALNRRSEMAGVETREITVKKDDNLWNIVKTAGFPPKDWEKIYNAPYNKSFKKKRTNPNHILSGDKFNVPKYGPKEIQDLVKKMGQVKKKIGTAKKTVTELKKIVQTVEDEVKKTNEVDQKKVKKLIEKAESLEDIADSAAGECSDMYSCIGGGLASMNFGTKAQFVRDDAKQIEKKIAKDKASAQRSIDALKKAVEGVEKELTRDEAEVKRLEKELTKAHKNPY